MKEKNSAEKSQWKLVLNGTLIYILGSIAVSLFADNTLLWMFLMTAAITGRYFKLLEQANSRWLALLIPLIGGLVMQAIYFAGTGPVPIDLLMPWVLSNLIIILGFSLAGIGVTQLFFRSKRPANSGTTPKKESGSIEELKKKEALRIDRLVSCLVLTGYVSGILLLPFSHVQASPCSKSLSPEDFITCYDPDKEYRSESESIVEPPRQRIPNGQPPDQSTAEAWEKGEIEQLSPEQIAALGKNNQPEPGWGESILKGLHGVGKDIWGAIQKGADASTKYIGKNWNKPATVWNDLQKAGTEFGTEFYNGMGSRSAQRSAEGGTWLQKTGSWFRSEFDQFKKNPLRYGTHKFVQAVNWGNTYIAQPFLKHKNNVQAHLKKNPDDVYKLYGDPLTRIGFQLQIALDNSYKGGAKQFATDMKTVLADKNSYWSVLTSPFGERTKQLALEGKIAKAFGHGAGELSVEVGIEAAETLASGGAGKLGIVVGGLTLDIAEAAGKTGTVADKLSDSRKLAETVNAAAKYQKNMPDPKSIDEYQKLAHYYRSREVFADPKKISHILKGDNKKNGDGSGFHHLPSRRDGNTYIIEGTKTKPNKYGVYEAQVVVNGQPKWDNNGVSTFFPDKWDEQQVVDAINEAYKSKSHARGNIYTGTTKDGLQINIALDKDGKILTAYPVYKQ